MVERAPSPSARGARLALSLLLLATTVLAQDEGAPPKGAAAAGEDAEAEAAALVVVQTIDRGVNERDPTGIRPVFATLDQHWARLSPKTIKRVSKSIAGMFAKLKPRASRDVDTLGDDAREGRYEPEDDEPVDTQPQDVLDCYHSAIGLLYDKPEGAEVLLPVLKLTHVKTWPEVQVLVLEGLGFRQEAALVKEFEPYLRHANAAVASAAAGALGRLREQPIEVRRRAVSSLVDAFSAAQKASEKEAAKVGEDDERPARSYLSTITVAFRDALTALTNQSFDKPPEWRAWFDAHGKDASW